MSTLIVGDVHGCADELEELVAKAAPSRVVLVGDLFTKGPDPAGVWRLVREGGFETVVGNHDDRLLRIVDGARPGDEKGRKTVERLDAAEPTSLPAPPRTGAPGSSPGPTGGGSGIAQSRAWLTWLRARPLFLDVPPYVVVHAGLHPSGERAKTTRPMALTMRRWPFDGNGDDRPFWWQVYEGKQGVVFGHDAARGHVRIVRDGMPLLVGLDTGCVYGGKLSGWFPETDTLVQVDARRTYAPWR